MKQVQEAFSKVDTKKMTNKLHQTVQFMKKKMQDIKNNSENNEIAIKITNKDAQKQISQVQKQIDSLQEKINARQMKLNIINPQIDKIVDDTRRRVTPDGINPNNKAMDTTVNNSLSSNKDFTSLNSQAQKLYTEVEQYNQQLSEAKSKMAQLAQQTSQTATTQSKLSSFFSIFKQKVEQAKPSISNIKNSFKDLPQITQKITNNIKGMGKGLKNGLAHVLKYAGALFSLRGIYSVLSNSASSWLSSQNTGAKQLSANIDYMKYAMGSALAPVIQFVTNLVYQLMKAIQSVAYALTGVNIFAKATANSYSSMAGSAKKAKQETKQLAGIHDEINNIQDNDNSDSGSGGGGGISPSLDLSEMDNTPNTIIEAIKNGNWYEVGAIIGQKLNEAMASIPWDKIQEGAKTIATNIGNFVNGFVDGLDWTLLGSTIGNGINTAFLFANTMLKTINWGDIGSSIATFLNSTISKTDWNLIGTTFANGLNTIIDLGYNFITTFNWKEFGAAICEAINGFIKNVDWKMLAKSFSDGIAAIFDFITGFIQNIDWEVIINAIIEWFKGLDFNRVWSSFCEMLGAAAGSLVKLGVIIGEKIKEAIDKAKEYFKEKIKECGGNIVQGILKGIVDAITGIGQWIYENIFKPFIDGFKNAFGIHSPSTVMEEQGNFIIEGLLNGIKSLLGNIQEVWTNIKEKAIEKFNDMKEKVSEITNNLKNKITEKWNNIKEKASETWNNIKNTASEKWQNIKENVSDKVSTIKNNISNKFSDIKENTKNTWNNIKDKFSSTWEDMKNGKGLSEVVDNIKNSLGGLGEESKTWGKDMMQGFKNGMDSMKSKIKEGAKSIANGIKSFLHFSRPDEGPLRDYETWMPDMVKGLSKTLQNSSPKLFNVIKNLTNKLAEGFQISDISSSMIVNAGIVPNDFISKVNTSIDTDKIQPQNIMEETFERVMSKYEGNNGKPMHVTIQYLGKTIFDDTIDYINSKTRRTGKNTIVTVGD